VLSQLKLDGVADRVGSAADSLRGEGVTRQDAGIAASLAGALRGHRRRTTLLRSLTTHVSDSVRTWANVVAVAEPGLNLAERLAASRTFAADSHFGVREGAWLTFRPFLAADLEHGLELLQAWVEDDDANVRRFAVEGTRPRGVWCTHLGELKESPELGLPLLEPVRSDASRYVRLSVANWLNDASKSRPEWVREVCADWTRSSPTNETAWIVNHATRSLRKKG
jgi:3-methyladenine DNA glycosylase AlkC